MNKIFVVALLMLSAGALGNTTCTGALQYVSLNPDNDVVQFNYGFGTQYHCKLSQEYNGVSPESCQAVYSMLLAAQLSSKKIEVRYNGDFSCASDELGNYETTKKLMYWIKII
ncbi:hypothetical protein [Teredinibacter turnerae]|nr:hypothetical protein [Teredinibacter turnerae]